jgi:hypothetical protein
MITTKGARSSNHPRHAQIKSYNSSRRRRNSRRDFPPPALAAAAGVEVGKLSIRELGELDGEMRYCDAQDNLSTSFKSREPYRRFGDFQGLATLPCLAQ